MTASTSPLAQIEGTVLGLDPGSYRAGYALLGCTPGQPVRYIECGVLDVPRRLPLIERIRILGDDLDALVREFSPVHAVVEDIFSHRLHPKGALVLGQARGAMIHVLLGHGISIHSVTPTEVKKAIGGHGRATKAELRRIVMLLAGLESEPPTDASDALAMAYTLAVLGYKDQ